jgi:hypothetical protein
VYGHDRIELLEISVGNSGEWRASSSVVDQAIETAKAAHGMVDHRLDISFEGDIRAYEARSITQFACEFLSSVLPAASNYDLGSMGDEPLRSAGTNATCAPCNDRNLVFERSHQFSASLSQEKSKKLNFYP